MEQIVYDTGDKSSQHLLALPLAFGSDLWLFVLQVVEEKSGIFFLSDFVWKTYCHS